MIYVGIRRPNWYIFYLYVLLWIGIADLFKMIYTIPPWKINWSGINPDSDTDKNNKSKPKSENSESKTEQKQNQVSDKPKKKIMNKIFDDVDSDSDSDELP